jgi:uncharacterized protein (TIGR00369 family)
VSSSTNPGARDPSVPRDPAQIRAAIAELVAQEAYGALLGYRLADAADLAVTLAMPLRPELFQAHVVHGGAISSLAEAASTLAILTRLWPDYWATTVEQGVQFLRPVVASTGELIAFAHVRRFGKTISFVEATITYEGREVATSRSTLMRQARPR